MANSSMATLPSSTAPAPRSLATAVESNGGLKPLRILEPAVVSMSFWQKMSFKAIGTPSRGDSGAPCFRRASAAAACASAPSGSTRR